MTKLDRDNADRCPPDQASPKIVFFCKYPFHAAMLERAFRICQTKLNLSAVMTAIDEELIAYGPLIVITADDISDETRKRLRPDVKIIFTRHGFSSKKYLEAMLRRCDVICVSSAWVRLDMIKRYGSALPDFWITGFTATDDMWSNLIRSPRSDFTTLLYAPTWNDDLTADRVIGTEWAGKWLKPKRRRLMVKLHPHTSAQCLRDWLKMAKMLRERVVVLHPDANVYSLMSEADILLTDISSVMFYWLALNRPVVLVDPIPVENEPFFDPDGPEWTWRDMGQRVGSSEELLSALEEAEKRPNLHARQRRKYRTWVFGNRFDGKASERLAGKIFEMATDLAAARNS